MKKFWIVFGILVLVVGGGFGLMWRTMSQLEESITVDGGVLVWDVGGSYAEERDDSFWGQVSGGGQSTLRDVLFGLYRAAEDDRITALVLDFHGLSTDWAKVDEIRTAISHFKEQGKPVVAYLDGGGTQDYALACLGDRIVVSPEASLMVLGVKAELAFMKDTLDKLGMKADFIHVGAYKSAPERMTRSESSKANREMITSIVEDRYDALVNMLADSRGVEPSAVRSWVDRGMFDAPSALNAGLADTLMYYDQMIDHRFGDESVTAMADYLLDSPGKRRSLPRVAVVYVTGVIMPGDSRFDRFQGKIAGSNTVTEHLESVGDDEQVEAVILRVDSPGGSALASDLIWQAIRKVQESKPVIVSMSGYAASGGYYVSCPGDSIFADPGTLTGSIGVYAGKLDRSGMYRKIGVNREFITRGENALLFSDAGGFTEGQRTLFQGQMDDFYQRFLAKVADGREMTPEAVHAVAQGRVWTGRQAMEHGLVDELGGFHRAVVSAKWMIGLTPEDKVSIVTFSEDLSFLEKLLIKSFRDNGGFGKVALELGGMSVQDPYRLTSELAAGSGLLPALRQDGTLAALALLDGRPVAMMPFWIRMY